MRMTTLSGNAVSSNADTHLEFPVSISCLMFVV